MEAHKETIRRLYLKEDKTKKEVKEAMESMYGFKASEKQYERQFKRWGFRKNLKAEEWKFVSRRLEKRKREGKETDLKIDGILVPRKKLQKEIDRNFETALERYDPQKHRLSQTPDGLAICTPPALHFVGLQYDNLPFFGFRRAFEAQAGNFRRLMTTNIFDLKNIVRATSRNSWKVKQLENAVNSLAPTMVPNGGQLLAGGPFRDNNTTDPFEAFLLAAALASNRMDDGLHYVERDSSGKWFQNRPWTEFLNNIRPRVTVPKFSQLFSRQGPELEAFAEILFKEALLIGSVPMVRILLENTPLNPNSVLPGIFKYYHHNGLPLQLAISKGDASMIRLLLDHGADLNRAICRDSLLLPTAIREHSREFLDALLPFVADFKNYMPRFAERGYVDLVQLVLNQGADPNQSYRNETPLGCATKAGNIDMMKILIAAGADIHGLHNVDTRPPLFLAAMFDQLEATHMLLEMGADMNITDGNGSSVLQLAMWYGHMDIAALLLNKGAYPEVVCYNGMHINVHAWGLPTPLQIAANSGHLGMVSSLLEHGADPNAIQMHEISLGDKRKSPLLLAVQVQPSHATPTDKLSMVKLLLEAGATVNFPYIDGKDPTTPVIEAMRYNHQPILDLLLAFGAVYSIPSPRFPGTCISALVYAARMGDMATVKRLHDAGEDVNALSPEGKTPLAAAIQGIGDHGDHSVAFYLLSTGADINHPCAVPSALEAAISQNDDKLVDSLLENGARLDDPSALCEAARLGSYSLVKRLMHDTLDYETTESRWYRPCYGHAALCNAVSNRDANMVQLILDGGVDPTAPCLTKALEICCTDESGLPLLRILLTAGTPVDISCICKRGKRAPELLGENDDWPDSPLQYAANARQHDIVRLLIANGANVNYNGHSRGSRPALESAIYNNDTEMVEILLQSGASLKTFLQAAIDTGSLEIIDRLLEAGADVNATSTKYYCTALEMAITQNETEIVTRLLEAGADANTFMEESSTTALGEAASWGFVEIMIKLLEAEADVNAHCDCYYGQTALQAAAFGGSPEAVIKLLDAGANVNAPPAEKCGVTALQAAARNGYLTIAIKLLETDADVNAPGAEEEGRTALEGAAEHGRIDMVQLLLNAGAEVKGTEFGERQYENAVGLAKKEGHNALSRLIQRHRKSLD